MKNDCTEAERERCACIVDEWMDVPTLKLRAGEMTTQEVQTVRAVLRSISRSIRQPVLWK